MKVPMHSIRSGVRGAEVFTRYPELDGRLIGQLAAASPVS